jgi:hypothetical protein
LLGHGLLGLGAEFGVGVFQRVQVVIQVIVLFLAAHDEQRMNMPVILRILFREPPHNEGPRNRQEWAFTGFFSSTGKLRA